MFVFVGRVSANLMTSSVCLGSGWKFHCSFSSLFPLQDLSALAKELRELRVEEGSRPPVKVKAICAVELGASCLVQTKHTSKLKGCVVLLP